jgi:hypothetical protein
MAIRDSKPPARPRRAPRSEGRRTTLRVPPDLEQAARALAAERNSSLNDALLTLARLGSEKAARAREIEMTRKARLEAFWAAMPVGADHPTEDEQYDAIFAPWDER